MSTITHSLPHGETYGGIEMKLNAKKNTYLGFAFSIGLHALLFLLYVGWTWVTTEKSTTSNVSGQGFTNVEIVFPPPTKIRDVTRPTSDLGSVSANPKVGIP